MTLKQILERGVEKYAQQPASPKPAAPTATAATASQTPSAGGMPPMRSSWPDTNMPTSQQVGQLANDARIRGQNESAIRRTNVNAVRTMNSADPGGLRTPPPMRSSWPDTNMPTSQQVGQLVNDARVRGQNEAAIQQTNVNAVRMMDNADPGGLRTPPPVTQQIQPGAQRTQPPTGFVQQPDPPDYSDDQILAGLGNGGGAEPSTIVNTPNQPSAAQQAPATAAAGAAPTPNQAAAAGTTQNPAPPQPMKATDTATQELQSLPPNATPEMRAQVEQKVLPAVQAQVQEEVKADPARVDRARAHLKNPDSPEAQKFHAESAQDFVNQVAGGDPAKTQDANFFGQAMGMWDNMGPMGQAAFMIGVPAALIGLLSGDGLSGILGGLGLGALGIGAGAMGMFGEGTQRNMGRLLGDLGEATGFIAPSARDSGMFAPGSQEATQQRIADAIKQAPRGQGAAVGQKMLDEERAKFDQLRGLHSMNPELAYSYLMGMRGDHAPKTREEAASLFDRLNNTYDETGQKGYLYNQALAQARAQRDAAKSDTWKNVGSTMADWANRTLGTNLDTIPEDDEALARRLQEEYGFEKPAAAVNRLLRKFLITKAARCWAGYEPVPGKEPYSENSCRPVGSKKKKQTGKERHHEKTKQGGAQS